MLGFIFCFTMVFAAVTGFIGYYRDKPQENTDQETIKEEFPHTEKKAA